MAFTKITDDLNIIQALDDEPNVDSGMSAAQLKAKFDEAPNKIKTAFNNLIDALGDQREGYEASSNISAAKIYSIDESDNNVQAKLEHLKELVDNVVLGDIPDNSITKTKLTFGDTIPTNEQMGVLYLASKYHNPINAGETEQQYTTPTLTNDNRQGYTITSANGMAFYGMSDVYTFLGGDGNGYGQGDYDYPDSCIIIQFPNYIKISSIIVPLSCSGDSGSASLRIYGSNDGITYESVNNFGLSSSAKVNYTININSNKFYKYIKLNPTDSYGLTRKTYMHNDIKFNGVTINSLIDVNTLKLQLTGNAKLNAYELYQIVKMKTPSDYIASTDMLATLDINDIGPKELPNDLQPSTRYSLIYDGTSFVKEV